jgi:hypothetical protein
MIPRRFDFESLLANPGRHLERKNQISGLMRALFRGIKVVEPGGIEPPTS